MAPMAVDPERPSVLFLSQALPYPADSGGKQRTFHVLRELEKGFRVHLLAFHRRHHQADPQAVADARAALGEVVTHVYRPVSIPSEWSKATRGWDHLRSVISGRAYSYYQYAGRRFEAAFRHALDHSKPKVIHFDSIDFHRWFREGTEAVQTCTHHDIESDLLARRARTHGNPALSRYVTLQARRMRKVEEAYAPRFHLNLTMSPVDTQRLRSIAPDAPVLEVPNAVSLEDFLLDPATSEEPDTVVFVGPTYLFANRDAVEYLLGDIWPGVREAHPTARLLLVGRNASGEPERFARIPGVEPLGRVPDVRPVLRRAACSVIPIRVGGGTRIKLLESWAMGRAVVTTSLGAEGLSAEDGVNAMIRDDPRGFAEAVAQVLKDAAKRRALGRAGRRTVETAYSWERVGERLRAAYREMVQSPSGSKAAP